MRRFYVVGHHVWAGSTEVNGRSVLHRNLFHPSVGSHGIHLIQYSSPENADLLHSDDTFHLIRDGRGPDAWEALPEVIAWRSSGSMMLLSADFKDGAGLDELGQTTEDVWHSHPEVARLQHPSFEGTIPLQDLHQKKEHAHKRFKKAHLDALGAIGIQGNHTVLDVHRIASKIDPQCKLGVFY